MMRVILAPRTHPQMLLEEVEWTSLSCFLACLFLWLTLFEEDLKKRFRPNLIISGGDHYEEDQWESLSIGNHRFKIHGSCTRCQMVSVVPETGQKSREPLVTLAATRGSNMKFGVHASYVDYFGNPKEIPDLLQTETSILITNKIREELYID